VRRDAEQRPPSQLRPGRRHVRRRAELNARRDDEPPHIWFKPLKSPDHEYTLYDYNLKKPLTRGDIMGYLDEYYSERELQE
jgi:hypothetical protein